MGGRTITLTLAGLALLAGILLHGPGPNEEDVRPPGNYTFETQPTEDTLRLNQGEQITFQITCTSADGPALFQTQWKHLQHDPYHGNTSDHKETHNTQHTDTLTITFDVPGHHWVDALCNSVYSDWSAFVSWTVIVG